MLQLSDWLFLNIHNHMANVLPESNYKDVTKAYVKRLIVLFSMFVAVVGVAALLTKIPSAFLVMQKNMEVTKNVAELEQQLANQASASDDVVASVQNYFDLISKHQDDIPSHVVVQDILIKKSDGIRLSRLQFEKRDDETFNVFIEGFAAQRSDLLEFTAGIETLPYFGNNAVRVPPQSLARPASIEFTLSAFGTTLVNKDHEQT